MCPSHVQLHPHMGQDLDEFDFFSISIHVIILHRMLKTHMTIIRPSESVSLGKTLALSHEHGRRKMKKAANFQILLVLPYV